MMKITRPAPSANDRARKHNDEHREAGSKHRALTSSLDNRCSGDIALHRTTLRASPERRNRLPQDNKPLKLPFAKYPSRANKRGPGDPSSDRLPQTGSLERAAIDIDINKLYPLISRELLPNFERALIHPNKTYGYILCEDHVEGGPKALFFRSLGFLIKRKDDQDYADKEWKRSERYLVSQIRKGLQTSIVADLEDHEYGPKLGVYVTIQGPNGRIETIRTVWQYRFKVRDGVGSLDDLPWLTTAFKEGSKQIRARQNRKRTL